MSEMATCPKCGQPVTIGNGLTDSTEVRCPLCEAEFVLTGATDLATTLAPDGDAPEVIPVVADVEETSSTPDSPGELEADVQITETAEFSEDPAAETAELDDKTAELDDKTDELDDEADSRPKENEETDHPSEETGDSIEEPGGPAAEEAEVRARCPCCNAEFGLDEVLLRATGEPLGREAVAAITAEGQVKELPGPVDGVPDFAGLTTRDDAPRIDIDLGNATGPAVSDGAFDLVTDGDDDVDAASASTAAFGRRRSKEKSMMREFTGIVLGGVAGLAIAYYGLNFFGGPRFDFLEIYLPGIEHTSGHRPGWLPGATATDVNPEDADFQQSELEN